MGEFPRKSDGRRVFTVEFKRGVVQQLLKGEKTLAEVSRELDIQPSVVRQWKRRFEAGATAAEILEGRRHEDLHGASRVRGRVVQSMVRSVRGTWRRRRLAREVGAGLVARKIAARRAAGQAQQCVERQRPDAERLGVVA